MPSSGSCEGVYNAQHTDRPSVRCESCPRSFLRVRWRVRNSQRKDNMQQFITRDSKSGPHIWAVAFLRMGDQAWADQGRLPGRGNA